jgi:hypothetical protein
VSARPFVRMEHLGSHWTDFNEILYLSIYSRASSKYTEIRSVAQQFHNPFYELMQSNVPIYKMSTFGRIYSLFSKVCGPQTAASVNMAELDS